MKYIIHEVKEFLCDGCGQRLWNHTGAPYIRNGNTNYCHECALIYGIISEEEYLKDKMYDPEKYKVSFVEGHVCIEKKRRTQDD